MTTALETIKAALPPAPDGWVIGGYEEFSVRQSTCADFDGTPWPYSFSRLYNRTDDAAERDRALADAGVALQASMAAKQPRIDALMAQLQEINTAITEALQRGDQARIDALGRDFERVQAELNSVYDDSTMQEQQDAIGTITMQDRSMEIAVQVNSSPGTIDGLQAAPAPAGATLAFRGQELRDGVTSGHAIVLFGDWRGDASAFEPKLHDGKSSVAAQVIVVTVTADPARLDSLLDGIDLDAIAGLID